MPVTALGPIIEILEAISCAPNTSSVGTSCMDVIDLSVKTSVSCRALMPVIILEPDCSLKSPAVLVTVPCHTSGCGPISGSTLDQRIRSGS